MGLAVGEHGPGRQATLVVEHQVELDGALGPLIAGPVEDGAAQVDDGRVDADQRILESEGSLTLAGDIAGGLKRGVERVADELPGAVGIGVAEGAARGRVFEAQMPQTAERTGHAAVYLAQGVGRGELAEHHGHELVPAGQALGPVFGAVFLDGLVEAVSGDEGKQLRKEAGGTYHCVVLLLWGLWLVSANHNTPTAENVLPKFKEAYLGRV